MFDSLISSLTVRNKILLLLMLFAIPLGWLTSLLVNEKYRELDTATRELRGLREISQLQRQLYQGADAERVMATLPTIAQIGRDSHLLLSPDADSYFCLYVVAQLLPNIAEHLSQSRIAPNDTEQNAGHRAIISENVLPSLFRALDEAARADSQYYAVSKTLETTLRVLLNKRSSIEAKLIAATATPVASYIPAMEAVTEINSLVTESAEDVISARVLAIQSNISLVWTLIISATLGLPLLSWVIVRNITRRLAQLNTAMAQTAQYGDLTQQVALVGGDEISGLSQSFNTMVGALREMVDKVALSGSRISTSTIEIAAVSKQQQATSAEIAATTTQIEATSKQIAFTSEQLSKTMHDVQGVAGETATLAGDGQTSLDRMRDTMQGITEACVGISSKLEVLNQRASRIGDVVTTIAKVADQTNLLSLNAAIEAEKAGEFGHGFAVVAREIRRLADQTAASTVDIEKMVKEIQSAVAGGVMGMEKFANDVRVGAVEVESTSSQFATILSQIQTLTPSFHRVSEGMGSQVLGARQITESLSQLSTAARQTADSLSQSNVSIDQLNEAAVTLKQEMDRFHLEGRAHARA